VIQLASECARRYQLRGADAVHLAAAQRLRDLLAGDDRLFLVASDRELLVAAADAGFSVEDPAAQVC
jgi:predicted nucleic acid-binding protein